MDLAARWADPTRDHRHRAQDFAAYDRAIPRLRLHNQNITVAASIMAERNTVGLLS